MGVRSTTVLAPLSGLLLACVLTTSCALDDGDGEADPERLELEAAADALSVSVLRPGAERAFARGGHALDGGLSCTNEAPAEPSADPEGSGPAGDGTEEADGSGETAGSDGADGSEGAGATGQASPPDRGGLAVYCTGVTGEGEEVAFEGRLARAALAARGAGDDSLPGEFTGSVAGERVFALDCFQCAPEAADGGARDAEAAEDGDGGGAGGGPGAATPEVSE
ncbi:hypothetical protein [Nocardiopsis sp. NRRL B-16309]|uniref:hypothetical protein n=1 Tax=Nocardiopsis sp. NRRL B-16309 TaxID=1519494 RepID=UPI0006C6CCC8|nr:hypothetical protein [Nocardiopsis sp. NRRL B-16309]KOX07862.1 hypothetical protein ADL05_28095 [Nocardiopsis sp. NRRL B-16309]